jgi:hypothetical protein
MTLVKEMMVFLRKRKLSFAELIDANYAAEIPLINESTLDHPLRNRFPNEDETFRKAPLLAIIMQSGRSLFGQ